MIVRSIALGQVQREHARKLLAKELGVSLLNGLIWGSALGLIAYWLYHKVSLGLVMTAAMTLNLGLAATAGVLIPLTMIRFGRDPALGIFGADHRNHRQRRILHFPGPGHPVSGLTRRPDG